MCPFSSIFVIVAFIIFDTLTVWEIYNLSISQFCMLYIWIFLKILRLRHFTIWRYLCISVFLHFGMFCIFGIWAFSTCWHFEFIAFLAFWHFCHFVFSSCWHFGNCVCSGIVHFRICVILTFSICCFRIVELLHFWNFAFLTY